MKKPVILILNEASRLLAGQIAGIVDGSVEAARKRCPDDENGFVDIGERLAELFAEPRPIIAIMASGSLIRLVAPMLGSKKKDPPVIAVSPDGAQVVPLLGGHHGANGLAREIAKGIKGNAAITTAGDIRFGIALDEPPKGLVLANEDNAKRVMAELNAGAMVKLSGNLRHCEWMQSSTLPFDDDGKIVLKVSETAIEAEEFELIYHPKTFVIGIGCERNADAAEAIELVETVLRQSGIARQCIAAICSIDVKADENAIHAVADYFGVRAVFYSAEILEQQSKRLKNPSQIVFDEVGCHGVAEGAALTGVGNDGELVVEKVKSKRVTCALARSPSLLNSTTMGRGRGQLFVVGIGPGGADWRSPQVSGMIKASSDLVGYSLYLDLVADIAQGKIRHDFDLGREEDRVRHAMELAGEGKKVSLVCSGDAGIYAMATLVFELLAKGNLSDAAKRIAIEVSPGISALQAAAARAGAPLGHDFCTISLSDLLTPWADIQRRVKAAAEGDFVIAFYNPVSRRRRTQLAYARDKLLEHRHTDTPVILATNLGREGESVRVVPLGRLNIDDVDMLTVVVVGSSDTRVVTTGDAREWVYTPRGYSAKTGSQMNQIDPRKKGAGIT